MHAHARDTNVVAHARTAQRRATTEARGGFGLPGGGREEGGGAGGLGSVVSVITSASNWVSRHTAPLSARSH